MTSSGRKHALERNRPCVRARTTMWNKTSIMRRRNRDFTGHHRSSLAKSLISLHPLLNIITIIGHWAGIMLSGGVLPPPQIFAAGAIANDLPTHPQAPRSQQQVLT